MYLKHSCLCFVLEDKFILFYKKIYTFGKSLLKKFDYPWSVNYVNKKKEELTEN